MDNLTHSLVGLTAAKAGLEKLSPGATALCLLAANAPDADIVVLAFGDRWTFLQHHRGITHAIIGVVTLAFILPLIFYGVDLLWARLKKRPPKINFKGLMIASFIVSATHPLLDWTNNYGVRLLLPWSQKWSYGDLVFIVDPYLWLILGGASFLLSAKTRVGKFIWAAMAAVLTFAVVASPRSGGLPNPKLIAALWIAALLVLIVLFVKGAGERWGARIAFAAFALVICYWGLLSVAHSTAVARGSDQAAQIASSNGEMVGRLAAMPRLANPFRWDVVFETDKATYRFDLALSNGGSRGGLVRYQRPGPELQQIVETISQQRPVRVFLGFARFPVLKLADPGCATRTLVQFADLRYTEPGRSRGTFAVELPVDCPDQAVTGGR
jgi:inner membrane protein